MSEYINADAYIKYCDEHWIPLNVDAVKAQPTADVVEVVHGEWIVFYDEEFWNGKDWAFMYRMCSNCGWSYYAPINAKTYNYCPNCGADMRERREDEPIH